MAARAKPEPGKNRVQMMVRIAPQVRERLEEAAYTSGRSLSQEVELRLDRSFELVSMIDTAVKGTTSVALSMMKEQNAQVERHMLEMVGGNNLYMIWSALAFVIQEAEQESGNSIRDDEATKNAAERKLLGTIPGLFRNLPSTYSDFQERARNQSKQGLGILGRSMTEHMDNPLPPLGWTGPWPPEKD